MPAEPNFNPLRAIELPDVGRVEAKGLTVLIGPNSSGKTQLLQDIEDALAGRPRDLVVSRAVHRTNPEPYEDFLGKLRENRFIREHQDANGNEQIATLVPRKDLGFDAWEQQRNVLQSLHGKSKPEENSGPVLDADLFFQRFAPLWLSPLRLESRLVITNECDTFDSETDAPSNALQALFLKRKAERTLAEEITRVFARAVWVDRVRGAKICIRANTSATMPDAEAKTDPEEMRKYRQIESEGDGLRCYTGICTELLLRSRSVCLLDEPEMCLHPPQAYALGRFIGLHATTPDQAAFVATHSTQILRGIIQETSDLTLIRLTRHGDEFHARLIPPAELSECIGGPASKAEPVLDGLFASAVTVVEAEGDRTVYSAVREKLSAEGKLGSVAEDVHFVSANGCGGFAHAVKVYRELGIPVAVVADLDVIRKDDVLKSALGALSDAAYADGVIVKCQNVMAEIARLKPPMAKDELESRIQEVLSSTTGWENKDAARVQRRLSALARGLSTSRHLKQGGLRNFTGHPGIKAQLQEIIDDCQRLGLFLVPVGELEEWLHELMRDGPSKRKKQEWAAEAGRRVQESECCDDNVWGFVKQVVEFQQLSARVLATASAHPPDAAESNPQTASVPE